MTAGWQVPPEWQKDGSTLSGVRALKTGAWTSILEAKETRGGEQFDVIIKTFCVPEDVLGDPERITREREKFLSSARLQKELTDGGAKAWVEILRISEHPENTSFEMKKCGASLQDMLDRHVFLSAKDLYDIVQSVLQGFAEIFQKKGRSHGSLKASDVIAAGTGQPPAFRLEDPAPKGDSHSANDLYALGLIVYQLVEHKEWDPLTPIIPTKNWARFGGKRDRWIQFLNLLLSPNGCQEPVENVQKEALRLKPASPKRNAALVAAGLMILVGSGIAAWRFLPAMRAPAPGANTAANAGPVVDPAVKADWEKAHDAYNQINTKWTARELTPRYDHAKSREILRSVRPLVPEGVLTDTASYVAAAEGYGKAAALLQQALDQYLAEDKAGVQQDGEALADFQKGLSDYQQAKKTWDEAAAKFVPQHDHTRSLAIAQATQAPAVDPPDDAAGRHAAAVQFEQAAKRFSDALAAAKQEEIASLSLDQAQANFNDARGKYQQAREKWDAGSVGVTLDISPAKKLADAAKEIVAEPLVLSDTASYQKAADVFTAAAAKMDQANGMLAEARKDHQQAESDVSTAVARANEALAKKDYGTALSWYEKAANLGNAAAMFNVGELYELGRGVDKDAVQAAKWYEKAAGLNQTGAMVNLGMLYEKGNGVGRDYAKAMALYKQAAGMNDTTAMRNVAYLYANGLGVPEDLAEALSWDRKAAEAGDGTAMFLVGAAYEQGRGAGIDYGQAIAWYQKGAAAKNPRALNALGVLYETGRGVKQDTSKALEWYKKSAELNFAPAMSNLGALYDNGIGVTLDHAEALKWFKKGAELGNGMAMYNLAVLYETGRGTGEDFAQALNWYRKAAASEDAQAQKQAKTRLAALGFSE